MWFGLVRGIGGALLRFGALLLMLFGVHLLLTQALPHLEQTLARAQRLAPLQAELLEAREEATLHAARARGIALELEREKQQVLEGLVDAKAHWELRLRELEEERARLDDQLARLRSETRSHCDTFNPLKLWLCAQLRERSRATEAAVAPLLQQVTERRDAAKAELDQATRRWHEFVSVAAPDVLSRARPDSTLGLALQAEQQQHSRAEARVSELERELQRAQEAKQSWPSWLLEQWHPVRHRLVGMVLLLLALPYVQRTLAYFVLMPLASRARPLELRERSNTAELKPGSAQRTLTLNLEATEELRVRAGYARPIEGQARSQLLYSWRAPAISYAAGLTLLTCLRGDPNRRTRVSLSAPHDSNVYLMRVSLTNHPGIVLHPKSLVGVLGSLELTTAWRLLSWHAWATGQLRYILLRGSGSVILEGQGDLVAAPLDASRVKIEQELVTAFDSQLQYSTARTETFIPYLFGKTRLVDDVFEGRGTFFWQQATRPSSRNSIERGFDLLFGAIGKLLGF